MAQPCLPLLRAFAPLAVQAALLLRSAPGAVFRAFCDSRLSGDWGYSFGTLGADVNLDAILARALPA